MRVLEVDKHAVNLMSNFFKDNKEVQHLVRSLTNPPELRALLGRTGLDGDGIGKFVGQFLGLEEGNDINLVNLLSLLDVEGQIRDDITNSF